MSFVPSNIKSFRFIDYTVEYAPLRLVLNYGLDNKHIFSEEFEFKGAPIQNSSQKEAINLITRALHLAAGISYYKAAAPSNIHYECGKLSEAEAKFFQALYIQGLGEFAFKNQINISERVSFPFEPKEVLQASNIPLSTGVILPLGGGKDSLVSAEILKSAGIDFKLLFIGEEEKVKDLVEKVGAPCIYVSRKISPELIALNKQGALNGHVPISAIISFVSSLAAVAYGADSVLMSQEYSASEPNLEYHGLAVNHQFSKSFEFEKSFREFFQTSLVSGLNYFSLLRPLSELAISKVFSRLTQYHELFTSCNTNFRIDGSKVKRWCLNCPKCRFVFLSLAPFLSKSVLLTIFGKDLLDDSSQMKGFDELVAFENHKPFECVGEIEESRALFEALQTHSELNQSLLVKRFKEKVSPTLSKQMRSLSEFYALQEPNAVPQKYKELLSAHLRA